MNPDRDGSEPRWLTDAEMRSWRAFVGTTVGIVAVLDALLKRDCAMSLDDYEVLVYLSEAPDRRLRMSDLSSQLFHSQSRVTQRIDRLTDRGWVCREKCIEDRRVTYAVLTEAGIAAIESAAPLHVGHVREHVLDLMQPDELEVVGEICERLVTHLREPGAGSVL